MSLQSKMLEIMKNVSYLSKDDNVSFGQTKYRALSEEKVTGILHKQIVENGILVYPIEQTWSRNGNITHVDVKYRIVDAENPEDFIEVVSCGDGADTQDKGSGKAMTYAFKYMWLRTFAIPTGEDPDKISSAELDAKETDEQKNQKMVSDVGSMNISEIKVNIIREDIAKGLVIEKKLLSHFKVKSLEDITEGQFREYVEIRDKTK